MVFRNSGTVVACSSCAETVPGSKQRAQGSLLQTPFSLTQQYCRVRSPERPELFCFIFQEFDWWAHKDSNLGPAD